MKKIEVILKVTEGCNLKCKYCYNGEREYSKDVLSLARFEKLLRTLLSGYNLIHVIWHGGEPLLAGIDYFKAAMDVERRVQIETGAVIENSIQTNGTLINGEWISFFKKHGFRVGISFDGVDNERYRQGSDKVLRAMKMLKNEGMRFGCNAVVADNAYDLKKNYLFFKEKGLSFDFSRMIAEGGAKNMSTVDSDAFAKQMCELFDEWIYDSEGISVRSFVLYLNLALGGKYRLCSCASCHMKYLSITPDGALYNCARDSMRRYPFGNIDDVTSVSDIFNSDGAYALVSGSVARRNECKEKCELYSVCGGGCADVAITEGDITKNPEDSCKVFKTVYAHVKEVCDRLMKENTPLTSLNPEVRRIMASTLSKVTTTTKNDPADTYV